MQRLPLLKILEKLSTEDWKRLRIYLKKTYPKKQITIKILDVLKVYHPSFDSPKLSQEYLYKKIFPKKAYNYKQLQNQLIDLKSLVTEFLIQNSLHSNPYQKDTLLLQAYKHYQLDDFFYQQLGKMEKTIEQSPQSSSCSWLTRMKLAHEHYYYPATTRMSDDIPSIYQAMQHLDTFYALSKLRYACEYINRQNILNEKIPDIALLENIQDIPNVQENVLFRLYHSMLNNLMNIDRKNYPALKELILNNLEEIDKEDQLILFVSLSNLLSAFMKAGHSEYQEELMNLLQDGVQKEVFVVNSYFDADFFITIVDHGSKLQRFEWARQFIEGNKHQLELVKQESVVAISEALISYAEKDYPAILPKLRSIKGTNIHHEIRLRLLQVVSAFEMKDQDNLNSFVANFDRFVRRNNTIHQNTQKAVLNFLSIVRKLVRVNVDKTKLLEEMERKKYFHFRLWLKNKIEALK